MECLLCASTVSGVLHLLISSETMPEEIIYYSHFTTQKKWGKKVINFAKAYMARFRDKVPTQPLWFSEAGTLHFSAVMDFKWKWR